MAKELNVSMKFNADTSQAKAQLQDLQNQLNNIQMKNTNFTTMERDLSSSVDAAMKLKIVLQEATNVNTGRLDLTKFQSSLKQSGMSLSTLKTELMALGPDGTRAFASLSQSIQMAEMPMIRLSNAAQGLWNTFKNTMRWQLASAALHGIASGAQQAMTYVKDLNKSLTDIRIVTGMGKNEMAEFAVQANKAARQLSTTTNEYAKASLIFYQQGLTGKDVTDRTDVVIKMANVTGQTAETVSDQMTAIWNNFYDGSESLEHYADVLTALGAATASSTDEISQGLEKFAAIAQTVGLSYEYATTALATVTAQTRQSADIVGTAFKTLFARIEGLKLGETLEDGVSLNKYSEALSTIGVSILDANGEIKDMNTILDEVGVRWQSISDTTKIAVAQTVAGVRQYSQFLALMDNWKDFKVNLSIAEMSDGTLQEQQEIFAEGWEAASNKVRASLESIYSSVINDDAMIKLTEGFSKFLDIINTMIKSLGGLPGILTLILSIATKLMGPQIANGIASIGTSIATIVAPSKVGGKLKSEAAALQSEMVAQSSSQEERVMAEGMGEVGKLNAEYQARYSQMTEQERQLGQMQIDRLQHLVEENAELAKKVDVERQELEILNEELEVSKQELAESGLGQVEQEQQSLTQEEAQAQERIFELKQQETQLEERLAESIRTREAYQANFAQDYEFLTEEQKQFLTDSVDLMTKDIDADQQRLQETKKQLGIEEELEESRRKQTEELKEYIELVKEGKGGSINLEDIKGIDKNSQSYKKAAKQKKDYEKQVKATENAEKSLDKSEKGLANTIKKTGKSITASRKHFTSFSTTLTQGLGAVSGLSFGITGLVNAFKALNDPDTSGFEKVLGFITAASFSLPMLTSSFGQLGKMVTGLGTNFEILAFQQSTGLNLTKEQIATDYANIIGKEKIISLTGIENAQKEITEALDREGITMSKQEIAMGAVEMASKEAGLNLTKEEIEERAKLFLAQQANIEGDVGETASEGTVTGAKILHTIAQKLLNKEMLLGLAMMAPYLLLVIAIVGAVYLLVKALEAKESEEEKERKRLEEQTKAAKGQYDAVKKATEDAKKSVDDLKSSWDSLTSAQDALSGMVKGSIEWKEQLVKINQLVLDLINKYPELSEYVKNVDGMLTIDQEGYDKVLNNQLEQYNNSVAAQAAAGMAMQRAQREEDAFNNAHNALKNVKDISYTNWEKTGVKKVWDNSGNDTGQRATKTTQSKNDRAKNKTTTSKGGTNSKGRSYHYEDVYGDVQHVATSEDIYNLLKNKEEYTSEYLAKAFNDKTSKEWKDLPKYLQSALDNNETRNAILEAASVVNSAANAYKNSPEEIASAISTANSELLYGKDSEFANSEYGEYADDIVEVMTNGFDGVVKSFDERSQESLKLIETRMTGSGYDTSKYTGEIGKNANTDRLRQMYAVEMYGEGAKYKWETDKDGNTKRWIENANGEKVLDFEESGWNDDVAKETLANRLAANISEADISGIEKLIDKINNKIAGIDLTDEERHAIVSSTLQSGGEAPVYSGLSYDKLNQLQSTIGNKAYEQAVEEKQKKVMEETVAWINDTEREAKELNEILENAEMDTTDWENYVAVLQKTNKNLANNKEAAERVAKQNLKTSNAIFKINKAYEDNKDILDEVSQKDSPAYVKAMGEMQEAVNDWYDTALSYEEIEKLWDSGVLQKAIEGDTEAIKDLSLTLANDITLDLDVNLDVEGVEEDLETLKSTIQYMQDEWGNIEIGATANLNIDQAIAALNDLLAKNQITAEQANKYLNSIGYDPTIELRTIKDQLLASGRYEYTTTTYDANGNPQKAESIQEYKNYGDISVPVINAEKTNFAGFSAPPTPASTKSTKSSKDKSGGSERSPKDNKVLDDELDRYHYIREILEDISNELDAVGKAKDRAFGAAKLKNMDKEIALLQKQAAAEKQYLKEIEDYHAQDRKALAEYGATFDEHGRVSNYQSLMKAYVDQYNEGVAKYNSGAIDDDQFQAYEDNFEKFKKLLEQYEETNNLLEEQKEVLQDYLNAIADARLEKLKYNIEVRIDLKDDDLKLLDHLLNQIEDDAFAAAERIELLGRKAQDNLDKLDVYKKGVEGVLVNKEIAPEDIQAILGGDMSSVEKYRDLFTESDVETLREYAEALMDTSEELQEIRKQVAEEVINNFDAWAEKVDKAAEAFERLNGVLDHYKNIIGLIGKASLGISNDMIKDLNNTAVKNSINQLAASRKYLEDLQVQQAEAQKHLDEARKRGIKADIEMWENTVEHINDKVNEVQENMLSNWEATLQKINEIFQENVEMALEDAKKAANGYATFDIMKDQYDKTKEQRKQYLDDYEKMVRLNELNRQISKDIDNTDNVKSQEALRDLQNEINDLQASGIKMSQYDLDYLKKRYELKKAELSIEEAQNAMSTVRLRRDDEGNWGYVYTADQSKIDDAKNSYEQKMLEMRDLSNQHIEEMEEKILEARENMANEIAAIDKNVFDSQDAYEAEVVRITEYYQGQIDYYLSEMQKGLDNNNELLNLSAEYYATNYIEPMKTGNENFQTSFEQTVLGTVSDGITTTEQYGQTMKTTFEGLLGALNENYNTMAGQTSEAMKAAGTTMSTFAGEVATKVKEAGKESDKTKQEVFDLAEEMKKATTETMNWASAWQQKFSPMIEKAKTDVDKMTTAVDKLITTIANLGPINLKVNYPTDWPIKVPQPKPNPTIVDVITRYSSQGGSGGTSSSSSYPSSTPTETVYRVKGYKGTANESRTGDQGWTRLKEGTKSECEAEYSRRISLSSSEYDIIALYSLTSSGQEILEKAFTFHKNGKGTIVKGGYESTKMKTGGYTGTWSGRRIVSDFHSPITGATGMYTGEWGDSGRLAVLHQKELVLNAKDTENFLDGIGVLRQITNQIDLNVMNSKFQRLQDFTRPRAELTPVRDQLDQNVQITAEFPNAVYHDEIEQAFNNLIGLASQYAGRDNK